MPSQLGLKLSEFPEIEVGTNKAYPNKIDNAFFYSYAHSNYGIKYIKRNYQVPLSSLRNDLLGYVGIQNVKASWRNTTSLWKGEYTSSDKANSYVYEWSDSDTASSDYIPTKFDDLENKIFFINNAPIPMEEEVIDPHPESFKVVDKEYIDERHNGKRFIECTDSIILRPYTAIYNFDAVPEKISVDSSNITNNNSLTWYIRVPESFENTLLSFGKDNIVELNQPSFAEVDSKNLIIVLETNDGITNQIVPTGSIELDEAYDRIDKLKQELADEKAERQAKDLLLDSEIERLDSEIDTINETIAEIQSDVSTKANQSDLESLSESVSVIEGNVEIIFNNISEINEHLEKIDHKQTQTDKALSDLSETVDVHYHDLQGSLNTVMISIGDLYEHISDLEKKDIATDEKIELIENNVKAISEELDKKANLTDIPEVIAAIEHNDTEKAVSSKAVEDYVAAQDFADNEKINEFSERLDDIQGQLEDIDPNDNLDKLATFLGDEDVSEERKNTLKEITDSIAGLEATNFPVQQTFQTEEPNSTYAASSTAIEDYVQNYHIADTNLHLENNQAELIEGFFGERQPDGTIEDGERLDDILSKLDTLDIDSEVTKDSEHIVSSKGIYNFIEKELQTITRSYHTKEGDDTINFKIAILDKRYNPAKHGKIVGIKIKQPSNVPNDTEMYLAIGKGEGDNIAALYAFSKNKQKQSDNGILNFEFDSVEVDPESNIALCAYTTNDPNAQIDGELVSVRAFCSSRDVDDTVSMCYGTGRFNVVLDIEFVCEEILNVPQLLDKLVDKVEHLESGDVLDDTVTETSSRGVKSSGIYNFVKANEIKPTDTVANNNSNPVTSHGVYNYIDKNTVKEYDLTFEHKEQSSELANVKGSYFILKNGIIPNNIIIKSITLHPSTSSDVAGWEGKVYLSIDGKLSTEEKQLQDETNPVKWDFDNVILNTSEDITFRWFQTNKTSEAWGAIQADHTNDGTSRIVDGGNVEYCIPLMEIEYINTSDIDSEKLTTKKYVLDAINNYSLGSFNPKFDELENRVEALENNSEIIFDNIVTSYGSNAVTSAGIYEYVENRVNNFTFSNKKSIGWEEMLEAYSDGVVYDSETIGNWVYTYFVSKTDAEATYAKKSDLTNVSITLDSRVTNNSTNAVTSEGIYKHIESRVNNFTFQYDAEPSNNDYFDEYYKDKVLDTYTIASWVNAHYAKKSDVSITLDSTVTDNSSNGVTSKGIYDFIENKVNKFKFSTVKKIGYDTPTAPATWQLYDVPYDEVILSTYEIGTWVNARYLSKEDAEYEYVKKSDLKFDSTITSASINAVTSKGIYDYIEWRVDGLKFASGAQGNIEANTVYDGKSITDWVEHYYIKGSDIVDNYVHKRDLANYTEVILLNSEDELPPADQQKKGILYAIPEDATPLNARSIEVSEIDTLKATIATLQSYIDNNFVKKEENNLTVERAEKQ